MGIKSTKTISRDAAISRITTIYHLARMREYNKILDMSFEPSREVEDFVEDLEFENFLDLYKWPDIMVEKVLDRPFFRWSMFDNYFIE